MFIQKVRKYNWQTTKRIRFYDKISYNRAIAGEAHLHDVGTRIRPAPPKCKEANGKSTCRGGAKVTL